MLDANPDHHAGRPAMRRVVLRHVPEPSTQRLLLEKGDIDVARNVGPDQAAALDRIPGIRVRQAPKGALHYLALNMANPVLANEKVREALKYLVDYDAIAATIMAGRVRVHQSFLPAGFLGSMDDRPYRLDIARAKRLLAEAGYAEGFSVTMDVRSAAPVIDVAQAIQATFAEAGVKLEIVPGDNKQVLTRYRRRAHDIFIGRWGPDYRDPHTNASAFAYAPDITENATVRTLAWRNNWESPSFSSRVEIARRERDESRRGELYMSLQRDHQRVAPFVILFQDVELIAEREAVRGFVSGPSFDTVFYRTVTKD